MNKAIVIGASSGIGMEVGKLLISDGWKIGIAARRTDRLLELKAKSPQMVEVETIDVNKDEAEDLLLSLIAVTGGMDLFFYAPGIGRQNPTLDPEIEEKTVITNALGFTRMIGAAYRYMSQHGGGHIAAITSIAGTKGLGPAPSYSATKAFQSTYIEALEQLANTQKLNIRFTDVRPGFVGTALLNDGNRYPMMLRKEDVAYEIVEAIRKHKHVCVIDWRWRLVTALWRCIPKCIWRHLPLKVKKQKEKNQ
ncbi:MAG: SDR family NAD(P)-dependent oxidoreductase [Prevotella sp.]|jgi:short-subunit dehydrogenase|nr:SDR family NAD(P)-dependent oxidoreductase [Prevotella sp.]